jgi:hypothetical protein
MLAIPRLALRSCVAVQEQIRRFDRWPRWQQLRRRVRAPLYRLPDTGWFGLTPLQQHILICGFPASGTTLLQLMIENGLPEAKKFGRERSGWRAATYSLRNHSVLISKQPKDLRRLDPLRDFYGRRRARLKVVLTLRDPRDLFTVQRIRDGKLVYCGSIENWRSDYDAYLVQRHRQDTLVIRFEDLLSNPIATQLQIENFVSSPMVIPFDQFQDALRPDFDTSTLCGLRPVDLSRIGRWKSPNHHCHIRQVLSALPELPEALVALGYETDHSWAANYV